MKHILSVLVENKAGVLFKVAGLFSRRAFNIESLVVGVTQNSSVSRMTIVVSGSDSIIEQITKQLNKLIDVIKVVDITNQAITSEMAFIKIKASPDVLNEIVVISGIYNARIIDLCPTTVTLEVTGDEQKLLDFRNMVDKYSILEMVQTGALSIEKGSKALKI